MIAYIEGQIILIEKDFITLKTSDGVGYEVYILKQLSSNLSLKDYLALHIYTNVKEDDISLYGFKEIEEKELFTMLIKTSGVGPKLGLAILSVLSPNQLVDAVHQNNAVSFSEVPGIGKKTALKLCLDLKDKLKNKDFVKSDSNFSSQKNNTLRNHALNALSSLGISRNISRAKVDQILKENENVSLESLIKEVLKKS